MKKLMFMIFLMSAPELALTQTSIDSVFMSEVEIVAKKKLKEAGMKITRPDSMAIISMLTTSMSELLTQNTPVFIKSYGRGSQATASFRGTAASHTQLLWNGIDINSPARGYADLSLVPVFFIDDVYLLHGGSSLSEGLGAIGGSIHLENTPEWIKRNKISGIIEESAFHSEKIMAKVQSGTGSFRSVTRFMYDASANDFPFYNVGVIPHRNDTLQNAAYSKYAVLQELYFRRSNSLIAALRFWYQKSNRNLPQLMSYEGTRREEYQNDNQMRIQLEVKKYLKSFNILYFSGFSDTKMVYFRKSADMEYINDDAASGEKSFNNKLKINGIYKPGLSLTGNLEANYYQVTITDRVNGNGYDKGRMEAGLMLSANYKPTETTGLFLLSGSEYYDGKLIPFIPAAGFEWQVAVHTPVVLKMNLSRNYHKPGLNDLYWIPGGNPGLLPENGKSAEVSIVNSSDNQKVIYKQELSAYFSMIRNWIIWQPASNGAWYWEAANLDKVFSRGLEYDFTSTFTKNIWKFIFSGNYAFTLVSNEHAVSSVDRSRRKQLVYFPRNTGNLHGAAICRGWSVMADIGYTGRRYTQSNNQWTQFESVLNPFWLTNIAVQKHIHIENLEASIKVKADNLFNVNYQQILWRPMPGRFFSVIFAAGFGK